MDNRDTNTHVRESYDERSAPKRYENSENLDLKGMDSREPRLFRPDRMVYDERSEIPTETFVREEQVNSYGIDDRRDSTADSLLDQEEARNRTGSPQNQEEVRRSTKEVFEPHYWEQPSEPRPQEVPMPPAMAEFAVENHRREEVTPADCRPIISQAACTQPLRARPFKHMIKDIVLWRSIKDSAIIFSAGLVAMLAFSYFSFISVIAYASLSVLMIVGGIVVGRQILFAVQKRSGPHPFRRHMEQDVVISPEFVHQQVDNLLYPVNRSLTRMRNLYLADSLAETLKMMLYMYVLSYLGSWFNLMTLVIIGWVAAFTLPKVYMMYRRQIDNVFNKARGYVRMAYSTVSHKVKEQRDRIQNRSTEKKVVKETTTVTKVHKAE